MYNFDENDDLNNANILVINYLKNKEKDVKKELADKLLELKKEKDLLEKIKKNIDKIDYKLSINKINIDYYISLNFDDNEIDFDNDYKKLLNEMLNLENEKSIFIINELKANLAIVSLSNQIDNLINKTIDIKIKINWLDK